MNSINYSAPSHFGYPLSREIINNATLPDFTGRFRPRLSLSSEINEFQHTLLSPGPTGLVIHCRHAIAPKLIYSTSERGPFVLFCCRNPYAFPCSTSRHRRFNYQTGNCIFRINRDLGVFSLGGTLCLLCV